MAGKIRIILVDDHDIVILGIKAMLARNNDVEIVAVVTDGEQTLSKVGELRPDVVVLDIDLPKVSGIEVTEYITKHYPATKVLIHTSYVDETNIVKSFEAGALGYVPKTFKPDQLLEAIYTVNKGDRYLKGSISETFINSYFKVKQAEAASEEVKKSLSKREIEILKHIAGGLANQEIADLLNISIRTVEAHKHNIMNKLEIFSTVELAKYAIKHQIITL
jgi:two-component system response regulator NreC